MGRGGRGHQSSKDLSTLLFMEGRKWCDRQADVYFLKGSNSKVNSVMGNLLDLMDVLGSLTSQGHSLAPDWIWPRGGVGRGGGLSETDVGQTIQSYESLLTPPFFLRLKLLL